jgi:hypothetical protein
VFRARTECRDEEILCHHPSEYVIIRIDERQLVPHQLHHRKQHGQYARAGADRSTSGQLRSRRLPGAE